MITAKRSIVRRLFRSGPAAPEAKSGQENGRQIVHCSRCLWRTGCIIRRYLETLYHTFGSGSSDPFCSAGSLPCDWKEGPK